VTLHQARVAAQKVFAAKLEGRDPAAEKRAARRRIVADRVEDLLESFIAQRLSQNRSGGEIARLLCREIGKTWAGRSIHEISKRDIVEVITAIEQRGVPIAANKTLKSIKTFLRWCVGRSAADMRLRHGSAGRCPMWPTKSSIIRRVRSRESQLFTSATMLLPAMYAGIPDLPIVISLRQEGVDVNDGAAMDRAVVELWKAVDKETLGSVAVGGRPPRVVRLDPKFTRAVPTLRSPRGRGFTLLRQSNPAYHELATWFGPLLHRATLAFRVTEVEKLARRLLRARRTAQKTDGQRKPRGRPSRIVTVQPLISDLVARRKWGPTMGMKALTREVNRAGKWPQPVSQETVTRALDLLYEQTNDRRFERVLYERRARKRK
jgi:hypothetical protein